MKKFSTLTTLSLLCLLCAGCGETPELKEKPTEYSRWRIINIDGCEYIENTWTGRAPLTHKGNCNNPIHLK